jgi:DNA primase
LLETLSKYGKKLIILFDNDCTGINRATRLTEETGIRSVFLSGAKDISDYIKLFGQEKAKQHLNSLL